MDAKITSNLLPTRTLNDAPPAIVYHIFANIDILLTADILHIVHSCIPSTTTVTLSLDPLPPGILLLAFDEDSISRAWARSHLKAAEVFTSELLVGPYIEVLEKIINAISANRSSEIPPFFSADLSILWSGVCLVLRLLPSEYFATAKARQLEIHRIVLGHLHDNGPR
jgi:senataxin